MTPSTPAAPETAPVSTAPASAAPVPATPAPASPAAPAVPLSAREAIYAQYYNNGEPAPPAESTPTQPDGAALTAPAAPPPAPGPDADLANLVTSLKTELAQLREQMAKPPAQPEAPPAPEPELPSWLALLKEGKVDEAEAALAERVARTLVPQAIEQSVAQSRERARAEAEMESFVGTLRTENPDLIPMEKMIAYEAQEALTAAQAAGKIKSTGDLVAAYKTAVSESVDRARKLVQTIRGAGKQEALTTRKEVVAASTLPPQAVSNPQTPQAEPAAETAEDYFARRRAAQAARQGLALAP
jgi:hypothetical protein